MANDWSHREPAMSIPRTILFALALIGIGFVLTSPCQADKTAEPAKPVALKEESKRRVYVLHSGVHTILSESHKNIAAERIREGLEKRGVSSKDIVVLDNPYPTANWRKMFPLELVTTYGNSAVPDSKVAQDAYQRMDKALKAQGVKPGDDVVWIGHSAGGQMGLTMAYLAKNLEKYGDLGKEAAAYHFDMVILLGAPVGTNLLPPEVKLRHYFSPQDRIVRLAARYGPFVLRTFGNKIGISIFPPNLDDNDKVRIFRGVEHNSWDVENRVLDRIVAETNETYCPLWHSPILAPGLEAGMLRLMCQALDKNCKVAFEDPPWQK
jgi:pimeloyl-ACP methyl ester carboxylesterase